MVKWVTRGREGSKISKNGWRHLCMAPYDESVANEFDDIFSSSEMTWKKRFGISLFAH